MSGFTNLGYSTTDTVIVTVMEGWVLDNQQFQWPLVPQAMCNDRRSQRSNRTTYDLLKLTTWLSDSSSEDGGLVDWDLGDSLPAARVRGFQTVSFNVQMKSTQPEPRPVELAPNARIRDLVNNLVPGLMGMLGGGMEVSLVNHIKSVTPTALTGLTGTLDQLLAADAGKVIKSFEVLIGDLRAFTPAGSTRFKIGCYVTEKADDVLRTIPDYVGRGGGVGANFNTDKENILDTGEFSSRFMKSHKLAFYRVISSSAVPAAFGDNRTDALIERLGDYEIFFVIEDSGSKNYDLRSSETMDSPDGGLILAVSREPEVVYIDEQKQTTEMVSYVGRAGWVFFSPRGDIMRRRVDPADIA